MRQGPSRTRLDLMFEEIQGAGSGAGSSLGNRRGLGGRKPPNCGSEYLENVKNIQRTCKTRFWANNEKDENVCCLQICWKKKRQKNVNMYRTIINEKWV